MKYRCEQNKEIQGKCGTRKSFSQLPLCGSVEQYVSWGYFLVHWPCGCSGLTLNHLWDSVGVSLLISWFVNNWPISQQSFFLIWKYKMGVFPVSLYLPCRLLILLIQFDISNFLVKTRTRTSVTVIYVHVLFFQFCFTSLRIVFLTVSSLQCFLPCFCLGCWSR